jgi:hypothetical protein
MFADFQNQRRKRKIEAAQKPSSLVSVSRASIFSENKGAQPCGETVGNELSRTDS